MSGAPGMAAAAGVLATSAIVAVRRPAWTLPLLLVALSLRLPLGELAEIPTLVLLGSLAGRAPAIARAAARERVASAALLGLPLWVLLSMLWASQPWFTWHELGKWLALSSAALLALAEEREDPRPLIAAAWLAMALPAGWALAERLHLVAPLGDPETLYWRLIDHEGTVRGRALFYHPNRLAEFVEQIGLLLVACAVLGPLRWLCAAGAALAVAGTWASGSTAGFATMAGGGGLVAAVLGVWRARGEVAPRWLARLPRPGRMGVALALLGAAIVAAVVTAQLAFRVHGGLGPRATVYRYAWQVIEQNSWLGLGGGNWPLAVGAAPLNVSRFWYQVHTHSLPLQLWVELGALGLLIAAALFAVPIGLALRRIASCPAPWRGLAAGSAAGVAGLLAHDVVHYFLRQPADGILTGVLLGLAVYAGSRREGRAVREARILGGSPAERAPVMDAAPEEGEGAPGRAG